MSLRHRTTHTNSEISRSGDHDAKRGGGGLPLKNLLQRFPREGVAVLEDVVEGVKGTEFSALFLMVDLWGCCLGKLRGFSFGLVSFPWHATHVFRFRFQTELIKTPLLPPPPGFRRSRSRLLSSDS